MSKLKTEKDLNIRFNALKVQMASLEKEHTELSKIYRKYQKKTKLMQGLEGVHAGLKPKEIRHNLTEINEKLLQEIKLRAAVILQFKSLKHPVDREALTLVINAYENLQVFPIKDTKYVYKITKRYLKARSDYLTQLINIADTFNKYLHFLRKNDHIKTILMASKKKSNLVSSQESMTEGKMWEILLLSTDDEVKNCFNDFANNETVIPITLWKRELQGLRKKINAAIKFKKNTEDASSTAIYAIKDYPCEVTPEMLRQNYITSIQLYYNDFIDFLSKDHKDSILVSQIDAFCRDNSSWWWWVPVFIFDLFAIPDAYRPLEAKSIDALLEIQSSANALQKTISKNQSRQGEKYEEPYPRDAVFTKWYNEERLPPSKPLFKSIPGNVMQDKGRCPSPAHSRT